MSDSLPVICRLCNTLIDPKHAVNGTMDENRTAICKECDSP